MVDGGDIIVTLEDLTKFASQKNTRLSTIT